MNSTRTRAARIAASAAATALLITACDSAPKETTPTGPPKDPVTITVAYWDPGLEDLVGLYEKENTHVTIVVQDGDYVGLHDSLSEALLSDTGAPNLAAIDEFYMPEFMGMADDFVNLADPEYGAVKYENNYLPWKWAQASTPDNSTIIGLGTDAGGLALCYRADLFEDAGLPADREAVAAAMGDTWDGYLEMGQQYFAATGKPFIDNATNLMTPGQVQLGVDYYNRNGELELDAVKPAFDTAVSAITTGLSGGIDTFSDPWNAGLSTDAFATVPCASWMLPYMRSQAEGAGFDGQWDVTDLPGPGGSRGGTFFAIPNQFDEYTTQETYKFLEWLIQGPQQLMLFQSVGKLPSQEALFADEGIQSYTSAFFNDAPIGPLFTKSVAEIPNAIYYSPRHQSMVDVMERVLNEVQAGSVSASDAWDRAVGAAEVLDAS